MANTMEALCAKGHRLTVLAPFEGEAPPSPPFVGCQLIGVPVVRPPKLWQVMLSQWQALPWTIVRHRPRALCRRLRQLVSESTFDLIHAEQVQAWGALQGVDVGGVPRVWRAQNVESDLWQMQADAARGPLAVYLALEARRLARFEGEAVATADATLTLTAQDEERLAELAEGGGRLDVLPAPFVDHLPSAEHSLPGEPALVLLGSQGWRPNRDGAEWFVKDVWPHLHRSLPDSRLQVFGTLERAETQGVELRPPPEDSRTAFAPGSILIVPLHVASGVRMKILEAWARGIPVVATSTAARGLEAKDGEQLFIADDRDTFHQAVQALMDAPRRQRMVDAARQHLRRRHDLSGVVDRLLEIYQRVQRRQ